jgi:hypothetical protein
MTKPDSRSSDAYTASAPASDRWWAVGLACGATFLYLATAPAVVNPDGLGYLKLLPHNFAAGHLLYMPLLRQTTRLVGGDGLRAGRLMNALLGGAGLLIFYGIVRRGGAAEKSRFAALVATAGLGLSYGYWVQGADLETYAAAAVAVLATVRLALAYEVRASLGRALAVGAFLGISVLCHLSNVVLSPFVAWHLCRRERRQSKSGLLHAGVALLFGGLLALGSYAYAALIVRQHDLRGALRWVLSASHGFRQHAGIYRLADALYGLSKAIIVSPYLYEADAPKLLGQFTLGLLPLFALGALLIARRKKLPSLPWKSLLVWIAPYALLAIFFFGSDSERWIFVLPALWWIASALLAELPGRVIAIALLGYLSIFNLILGVGPAHRDTWTRHRAEMVGALVRDHDLLVFPGHSWDEYVSFFSHKDVEPFPFSYYAARDGLAACVRRLEKEVSTTRARGGRVLAIRLFDDHDEDPRGIDELKALDLDRTRLRALVIAASGIPAEAVSQLAEVEGQRVVRLDPSSPP